MNGVFTASVMGCYSGTDLH